MSTSKGDRALYTSKGNREIITPETACNNLHQLNKITDVLEYFYSALFSPKKITLLRAIKNNNFATFSGLILKNIKRYINKTIATAKCHLDR